MRLTHCVLACNENPEYLGFWPLVRDAWKMLIGVSVTLVYVGKTLHPSLVGEPNIIHWDPIEEWPTATQAQCVRLLGPALVDTSGAVIIGDIDCMPLNKTYFEWLVKRANEDQLVLSEEPNEILKEVGMCYNAGTPGTWRDLFGIQSLEDARVFMKKVASVTKADGIHAGIGWATDQQELYKYVNAWRMKCPNRLFIHDHPFPFPRLDRNTPHEWSPLNEFIKTRLYFNYYTDFHMPPYSFCKDEVEEILRWAIFMKRRREREPSH